MAGQSATLTVAIVTSTAAVIVAIIGAIATVRSRREPEREPDDGGEEVRTLVEALGQAYEDLRECRRRCGDCPICRDKP